MDFRAKYSRQAYQNFLSSFLPEDYESLDRADKVATPQQTKYIEDIEMLGECKSLGLNVYEIKHKSENDPRVSLSRETFRIMSHFGVDKALAVYLSEKTNNYRFSYITLDYKMEGKRVLKEYTNPRRYSYFLGPDAKVHTPEQYLAKKGKVGDAEDLKERFSVEVVNKDFYQNISRLFIKLAGGKVKVGSQIETHLARLKMPDVCSHEILQEFSVRLIGRLVFCWFLKKKVSESKVPLLPEEVLSTEALKKNDNYYHSIIEPLFFEVLNTPIDERKHKYKTGLWSIIPFLNGGLFSPHHHDFYETGVMGLSKYISNLKVPDDWLKELLDVFETYNFTIDENTSVDVDLSIDPEMLGRIFENLLAEINPVTGETARKSTGSYYTPRPIVEYMVDESLKQYLLTKTNIEKCKIAALLSYSDEIEISTAEAKQIINALDVIKVIDPACGSGAYPMGILQKMLLILQKIDPESKQWVNKKLASIDDIYLRNEIEEKFKNENSNYIHKLGIIQNSIYGVDIQPIATEISKLRFFLSLVVDENINDKKDNRGIRPLPNLEFKFVCANSLIGLPPKAEQLEIGDSSDEINNLKILRERYLSSHGSEKIDIEKGFIKLQGQISQKVIAGKGRDQEALKLANWDPFTDEASKWFDPDWMFGVKDGFDIVVANPPYLKERDNKKVFEIVNNSSFGEKYHQGKMDYWFYFLHKAIDLAKNDAFITYITSRYWLNSSGAKKLIKRISNELSFVVFVDIGKIKVFEKVAGHHMVATYVKNKNINEFVYKILENTTDDINKQFDTDNLKNKVLNNKNIITSTYEIMVNLDKNIISSNCIPLYEVMDITQGVVQNPDRVNIKMAKKYKLNKGDGVFILNSDELKRLKLTHEEKYFIRPFYDEKEIDRYFVKRLKDQYIIYITNHKLIDIDKLPTIKNHLFKYRKIMDARRENVKGRLKYYHLHWPREEKYFESEKLVVPSMFKDLKVGYQNGVGYFGISSNVLIPINKHYEIRYILSILNSKYAFYWFSKNGKQRGAGFDIGVKKLRSFPVKVANKSEQKPFVNIANRIIEITNASDYLKNELKKAKVKKYEDQIDIMVYKHYDLTYSDVIIVDPKFALSEKEYNAYIL